jgi:hypothetical protein
MATTGISMMDSGIKSHKRTEKHAHDISDIAMGESMTMKGEDRDDMILRAQGHTAAMPRSFSWSSAIGLGYS